MRRACDQCHGTDTQRECERGQCYAEHYERGREERWRAEQEEQRRWEAEQEERGQ